MTVPTPAHTLLQLVRFEEALPIIAAELTALVRMYHQGLFGLMPPDRHQ